MYLIDTYADFDEADPVDPALALRFARSHDIPMARPHHGGGIEVWGEVVGPDGCAYCEREVFQPDSEGQVDLTLVKLWLGY